METSGRRRRRLQGIYHRVSEKNHEIGEHNSEHNNFPVPCHLAADLDLDLDQLDQLEPRIAQEKTHHFRTCWLNR